MIGSTFAAADIRGNNLLLTIVIPTYNRADCLERLLTTLLRELMGLEGRVALVIGDNSSSDRTPEIIQRFSDAWRDTCALRHAENMGMDENFCSCAQRVQTPYFWFIGDDDLPRAGAVAKLLLLLEDESPDLIYLASVGCRQLYDNGLLPRLGKLGAVSLQRLAFARRTNVWTTYLSAMIVRTPLWLKDDARMRRYCGTHLSQLSWVFGTLKDGTCFIHVTAPCILATQGNTGGYKVLEVFGKHFPAIVCDLLASAPNLPPAILRRTAVGYLPNLIWSLRKATLGRFEMEDGSLVLRPWFGNTMSFACFIIPISKAPQLIARLVLRAAQLSAKAITGWDRCVEHITRSAFKLPE